MPTARESLLEAASAALGDRPWTSVRMAEVAAAAGVSRQTLYNEFHSKEGLARALVLREADAYLAGVDRALSPPVRGGADAGERFAAAAAWTLRSARRSPLIRAALTGGRPQGPALPDLAEALRVRAVEALARAFPQLRRPDLAWACDAALRLTVSYVLVPAPSDEEACRRVGELVRSLVPDGRRGEGATAVTARRRFRGRGSADARIGGLSSARSVSRTVQRDRSAGPASGAGQ